MSTFPQLLRRSKIASFDPAITRVYTSTPQSINRYSDFGLKYPVHRPKGPKYIKVNVLDAGRLLGSDWRSAETEARFVQSYGTGRVQWHNESESSRRNLIRAGGAHSLFSDEDDPDHSAPEAARYRENVEGMSPAEFKKYIGQVKAYRSQFLQEKLSKMGPRSAESLVLPEDKTWANLAYKGHIAPADLSIFQEGLAEDAVKSPKSTKLHTKPHKLHGLAYSRVDAHANKHNPLLFHPGRALDPAGGDKNRPTRSDNRGTNRPWVVSIGGAGAESTTRGGSMAEGASIPDGVDYTRENPSRGATQFRFARAILSTAPRVVEARVPTTKPFFAGRSLDRFRFDLTVEQTPTAEIRRVKGFASKEYVASEDTPHNAYGDKFGISEAAAGEVGGPRSGRKAGEGLRSVRSQMAEKGRQDRKSDTEAITDILARLAKHPGLRK